MNGTLEILVGVAISFIGVVLFLYIIGNIGEIIMR